MQLVLEIISHSIKNISRKKSRSTLTVIGIAIGITSVIIISLIGEIGKFSINEELNSLGINGVAFRTDSMSNVELTNRDLEKITNNSLVKTATPLLSIFSQLNIKNTTTKALIWGVNETVSNVVSLEILYGRLINNTDIVKKNKVCIVDKSFAFTNYNRENIVGKNIEINIANTIENYTVIGVVSTGKNIMQSLMGDIVPSFLYVPISTMQMYLGNDEINQIATTFIEGVDSDVASISIINTLSQKENIIAEDLNKQKTKLNDVLNIITIILSVIASISLVVAGLSVMTVMLVTVSERTREIGIKKSIGATNKRILLEFLIEAFLLSVIGSIVGTIASLLLVYCACIISGFPFIINLSIIITPIIITIICGVLFGIYPAKKASKLCPVQALRQEY